MIEAGHDIEIMNPDHIICPLDQERRALRSNSPSQVGRATSPAAAEPAEDAPIGLIPVDAIFSPVRKVSYKVEYPCRPGHRL